MKGKMNKVTYKDVEPLAEGIKQGLRVFVMAVIPLLIDQLGRDEINYRALAITGAIAVLMAIDKAMHLEGKLLDNDTLKGGIARF